MPPHPRLRPFRGVPRPPSLRGLPVPVTLHPLIWLPFSPPAHLPTQGGLRATQGRDRAALAPGTGKCSVDKLAPGVTGEEEV